MTPPYVHLASEILRLWQASLEAGLIAHPRDAPSGAPAVAADLNALGRQHDPFGEPFAEGTFVGKLESDEAGEEGLYNVIVRPSMRAALPDGKLTLPSLVGCAPGPLPVPLAFAAPSHSLLLCTSDQGPSSVG